MRDPEVDQWEDTAIDHHFAAEVGLGDIVSEFVDDDDDDAEDGNTSAHGEDGGDGRGLTFLLYVGGKRSPRNEPLGKKELHISSRVLLTDPQDDLQGAIATIGAPCQRVHPMRAIGAAP